MSSATPSSLTPSMSNAPVKRACDSCHRRKVKCTGDPGQKPCKNCITAGLTCTYNAIPQKKGPKGSRAKVLSELRESQRQSHLTSATGGVDGSGQALSPNLARTPGLVTPEIIDFCVDYFFQNFHPTQPILHLGRVQQTIMAIDHSIEAYCKMVSLCAYMMIQPNIVVPPNIALHSEGVQIPNQSYGIMLLEECVRVRKGYDYLENPTLLAIYTSFFIFSSYFCLDKQNTAWAYLRQGLTLGHIMGLHIHDTYKGDDPIDASRKRRLFWLLFITERAYAIKSHRPLTFYATLPLPTQEEDPTDIVPLSGFIHLINLYKPFDETFFGLWNKTRAGAVPSWLAQLQHQLVEALPAYLEGTETQVVDIRMSQQWLRTMVWQLAISHGFISSLATDNTMCFKYPIEISRELVEMSNHFSQHAMEVHGIGFIEKLFDVACTLIDVMAYVPIEQQSTDFGPRDYLNRFISLISTLRGGQSRYLPMLLNKVQVTLQGFTPNDPRAIAYMNAPPSNMRVEDMYEPGLKYESSTTSNPTSHEATPYDSPAPIGPVAVPLRHGSSSSMHSGIQPYSEHLTANLAQPHPPMAAASYPSFSSAMGYPELGAVVTTSTPAAALYHSHLPHRDHGYRGE